VCPPSPERQDSAFPSEAKAARIRAAARVGSASRYVADYVPRFSGIPGVHVPIPLLEGQEWPVLGRFDNPFVTLANPCAVKGILIFLAMADASRPSSLRPRRLGARTSRIAPRFYAQVRGNSGRSGAKAAYCDHVGGDEVAVSALERLSPEKRRLMALRLRKRRRRSN
jgi:hypothetical protein